MKRKGNKGLFEYKEERNADLLHSYRECLGATSPATRMDEVYRMVVSRPSKRFWVSEEQASKVISHMMKGKDISYMSPNKQKMFHEIYRRVSELRIKYPRTRIFLLIEEIVSNEAPCFYMTPESAKVIISQIKTKCYKQRLQSLPFLR